MGFFDFETIKPKEEKQQEEIKEQQVVETQPQGNITIKPEAESVQQFNALKNATTSEMVQALKNKKTLELFENDEQTNAELEEHAKQDIRDQLDIDKDKTKTDKAKVKFQGNEEACKIYGVEKTVPLWQQRLMAWGSGFWFVIYFLIASVTVAPISTFTYKLNVIFKRIWVSILVAIITYAAFTLGIPFLLSHLR